VNHPDAYFEELMSKVVDELATEEEFATFEEILLRDAELRRRYLQYMRAHALLNCRFKGQTAGMRLLTHDEPVGRTGNTRTATAKSRPYPLNVRTAAPIAQLKKPWWGFSVGLKTAAAAAVLFGAGLWMARVQRPSSVATSVVPPAPVTVLRHTNASDLELPSTLPGTVRLVSGAATARLPSGVELSLLGPLELEVRDAMQVRLVSGRLLADVPPHAAGFTVLTDELELWDLGTVFGVTVSNGVSDVFVFQGSVQVNESAGEAVDLCEAGQGVRAAAGKRPCKFAADFPEAAAQYRPVAGRQKALRDPAAALAAAGRVAALWGERWLPQVVPPPPPPVPGLVGRGDKDAEAGRYITGGQPSPSVGGRASSVQELSQTTAAARPPQQEESEMRNMTNTAAALAAAVTMGAGAAWAVPAVSNVQMTQRAGSRVVDITYDLAGEAAIVTLGIETNGAAIPDSAVTRLSGDVSVVIQPGTGRHIVWNAGADWPENVTETAKARVTAWSVDAPPLYCAIDVTAGHAASSYPTYYYPSAEGVPGGVTNDLYKTYCILMRRIDPTGGDGFRMGSPVGEKDRKSDEDQVVVVLTNSYYIGVYEITQCQWAKVTGAWPSGFTNLQYRLTRPAQNISYYHIREDPSNKDDPNVNWPLNDVVNENSFIGKISIKTGLAGFDLPTEAQWEYACRAGTLGVFYDGTINIANINSDANLNLLARYRYNNGYIDNDNGPTAPSILCTTENGTAAVGSYLPNAWGLYDMHGNVWEWCLDWYADQLPGGINPAGSETGDKRVRRGGSYSAQASYCRSAYRPSDIPNTVNGSGGFRIVRNLP